MEVYRIENDEGRGAYNGGLHAHELTSEDYHNMETERPCPGYGPNYDEYLRHKADALLAEGGVEDWFFGFASIEQLNKWFDQRHHVEGWYISIYKVDEQWVAVSPWQCTFKRTEADLIERVSLEMFTDI